MLPQRNLYFYTSSCPRENDSQRKIKEGGPAKKAEGWTSNLEAFNPPLTSRSTTITLLISFSPTGEEIKTESTRKKSNFSF